MKGQTTKKTKEEQAEDDSLFGLLANYKTYGTYFQLLIADEKKRLLVMISDNPGKWLKLDPEKYLDYKRVKKIDLGVSRLFVKYLTPEQIVEFFGATLGCKMPESKTTIQNLLPEGGIYIIETTIDAFDEIEVNLKKIINMTPQKKYGVIEHFLSNKA